ncbi:hypothetical protein EX30DRAFT_374502 [Ascodesmis nigricans]|uniref:Uncharacterized protein n=1 Tax=Ascodesmis nigricans TaxID=341454 RepID=A0A4S2MKM9_9PEZI|nr:hypothetical protein EX30DRAFT_374502 [Ascodesmis nigricans]
MPPPRLLPLTRTLLPRTLPALYRPFTHTPPHQAGKQGGQKQVDELLAGIVSGARKGIQDTHAAQQASQIGKQPGDAALSSLNSTDPLYQTTELTSQHQSQKPPTLKLAMNTVGQMVPEDQVLREPESVETGLEPGAEGFGAGPAGKTKMPEKEALVEELEKVKGEVFGKGDPHEGKCM